MQETNTLPEALRRVLVPGRRVPNREKLDAFIQDARAGVPDALIAKRAGLTARAVRRWRQERGIKAQAPDLGAAAVNAFGLEPRDTMHRVEASAVGGCFDVPEYVLRIPLKYEALARHIHAMHDVLGSTAAELSAAVGIRESDVEACLALWQAHLERRGVQCCGALHDPRFCCPRCGAA